MYRKLGLFLSVVLGILFALYQSPATEPRRYVSGRNNTVLFIVNEHPGYCNVHIATAQSLLEKHPEISVEFASFPKISNSVARVSSFATKQSRARDIIFHALPVEAYMETILNHDEISTDEDGRISAITKPGLEGIARLSIDMQIALDPWNQDDHLVLFRHVSKLIEDVDPAVIVLDTMFSPAIEATRAANRLHAFITPNMLVDNFPDKQPWLGMLWKYPAMGSGHPFPVPFRLMLQNIYLNFHLIYSVIRMPKITMKQKFLLANGVPNPINFYGLHRPDVPWITQTTHAATIPMDHIPTNVTCAGPITIALAPADEQDPELMRWIKQGKTILINLGSGFTYSRTQTKDMVGALRLVLESSDIQILWKYRASDNVEKDIALEWNSLMAPLEATGRVKIVKWLSVDPYSLLESGNIASFVTHGGANGFHESIAAGVPQIVLPFWVDLFNYAQLAEQIGVGVWGCRATTPDWKPRCLSDDILKVTTGPQSAAFQRRASEISQEATKDGLGRDISAALIAKLARKSS